MPHPVSLDGAFFAVIPLHQEIGCPLASSHTRVAAEMAEYTAEQVGRSEMLDPRTLTKFLEAAVPTPVRYTVGAAVVAAMSTLTEMSLEVDV